MLVPTYTMLGHGPVVLMLHGAGGGFRSFAPQVETLASLGFRADGHLLLEPGRLLDDPPGLLLKLMLGSLWQDQAKGEHERPPH